MGTEMQIPLSWQITVAILCPVAIFILAAWEKIMGWVGHVTKYLFKRGLAAERHVAKVIQDAEKHLFGKPKRPKMV